MAKYLSVALLGGLILIILALGQQITPNYANLSKQSQDWLFNLLLGSGTGLITSVILLWLYDENIRRQTNTEKTRRTKIAMKAVEYYLVEHFAMLISLYRSINPSPPIDESTTLESLFDEEFFSRIRGLNFDYHPFGGELSSENMASLLAAKTIKLQNGLTDILSRHGQYMDPSVTEQFENLISSRFVLAITTLPEKVAFNRGFYGLDLMDMSGKPINIPPGFLLESELDFFIDTLREHIPNFIALIQTHNKILPKQRVFLCKFLDFSKVELGAGLISKN